MSIVTVNGARRELREQLLRMRLAMPVTEKRERDVCLAGQLDDYVSQYLKFGAIIALYQPIRAEPNLLGLAHAWRARGFKLLLPVVVQKNAALVFAAHESEENLKEGAYGILEPQTEPQQNLIPDLVVLPCVGFNSTNHRLGYGGGYYDRTLAQWQNNKHTVLTVGVAYQESQCSFEVGVHDIALDAILVA